MRKRILFEDSEIDGPEWVVTYYTGYSEYDDEFESNDTTEIILTAEDFEHAVHYAQQYLRKMQSEEETSDEWASAEILSIEIR